MFALAFSRFTERLEDAAKNASRQDLLFLCLYTFVPALVLASRRFTCTDKALMLAPILMLMLGSLGVASDLIF